jgi:hypothetical protein
MKDYLHSLIKDINEPHIIKLIDELEKITRVRSTVFYNEMLLHYLQQSLRPNGASTKQIPIRPETIKAYDHDKDFILGKKIKNFFETELFWLFNQIAKLKGDSIEEVQNQNRTVYVFLNHYFKDAAKKKKIDSVNYLWR